MEFIKWEIELTLKGPVLSKSTEAAGFGIDAAMARNEKQEYYLPYTLVKGRLRQAWAELNEVCEDGSKTPIDDLLGPPKHDDMGASLANKRARLRFSDFTCHKEERDKKLFRISIDEERNSVEKGAYLVIDTPFAPGEEVVFKGSIEFFEKDAGEAKQVGDWVKTGLRWITSLGACRTVGFGRLINVCIKEQGTAKHADVETIMSDTVDSLTLVIKPQGPFCFSKKRLKKNLFESDDIISGAEIKGCIASTWREMLGKRNDFKIEANSDSSRTELCKHFENLRFTHAFPAPEADKRRPVVPPLSIVKEEDKYCDVALEKDYTLINKRAPSFAIDWKERKEVDKEFGWYKKPKRQLRVRTAMDRDTRSALDENLFAYEMIVPDGFVWLARVDMSGIDNGERQNVEKQLRGLLCNGLKGWSKTKVGADVSFVSSDTIKSVKDSIVDGKDDIYVITLQTPALLCDPSKLTKASGDDQLSAAYEEAWEDISENTLTLMRFFATQSLAGGGYLHSRFSNGKPYNPYLLTDAGSVFVLEVKDGKDKKTNALKCVNDWITAGLGLPKWAKTLYGDLWSTCPYIRQNGYGEVAVNIEVKLEKTQSKEDANG